MKNLQIIQKEFTENDDSFVNLDSDLDFYTDDPTPAEKEEESSSTTDRNKRLLFNYFKEVNRESHLLNRFQEKCLAATIVNCEKKLKKLELQKSKILKTVESTCIKEDEHTNRMHDSHLLLNKIDSLTKLFNNKIKETKNKFIVSNLNLVLSISRSYTNRGLPYSDLLQEGNLGLIHAVDKFDYTLGFKFSTYASWWIKQSMTRALQEKSKTIKTPSYLYENLGKILQVKSNLNEDLGRKPTLKELSDKMGMTQENIKFFLDSSSKLIRGIYSLDSTYSEETKVSGMDLLADESVPSAENLITLKRLKDNMNDILSPLNSREETILKMRYGIDQKMTYTLKEIGNMYGLTRERVRQIQNSAHDKIAEHEDNEYLKNFLLT